MLEKSIDLKGLYRIIDRPGLSGRCNPQNLGRRSDEGWTELHFKLGLQRSPHAIKDAFRNATCEQFGDFGDRR